MYLPYPVVYFIVHQCIRHCEGFSTNRARTAAHRHHQAESTPVRNSIRSHLHYRCLTRQEDIWSPATSPPECISDRDNSDTYVSLRLRMQNGISHLISALCVNCLISIPEYSRIRLRMQNGISHLISALCVNCLISILEYSRIIDYSIIWLSTCVTVFNTCWNFQCVVST